MSTLANGNGDSPENGVARTPERNPGVHHQENETSNNKDSVPSQGSRPENSDEPGASWRSRSLDNIVDQVSSGTYVSQAPTIGRLVGGSALFYPGRVNMLAGYTTSGKSWTAIETCVQEMQDGRHVFYVDVEDSEIGMIERLIQRGVDAEVIKFRFHYFHPDEAFTLMSKKVLDFEMTRWRPSVVIIDSVGEAMSLDNLDPNTGPDVAKWYTRLARHIARQGPAVVVIDHLPKSGGKAAIGSQRKGSGLTGALYIQSVTKGQEFDRNRAGRAGITCQKDRLGYHSQGRQVADLIVTPRGGGRLDLALTAGGEAAFRPTILMERVSAFLESQGGPVTQSEVTERVVGKGPTITEALRCLVAEGYVTRTRGAHNSWMNEFVSAYSESNDPTLGGTSS